MIVQVRAWLWVGNKGDATSGYQFVDTGMTAIQTIPYGPRPGLPRAPPSVKIVQPWD